MWSSMNGQVCVLCVRTGLIECISTFASSDGGQCLSGRPQKAYVGAVAAVCSLVFHRHQKKVLCTSQLRVQKPVWLEGLQPR